VAAIASMTPPHCLLIDSLGTWVANLLELDDISWQKTQTDLLHCLQQTPLTLILVAEETAWGVIPAYPSGRVFRDRLGSLIRQIGTLADTVYLVTAGHVLNLTQLGQPLTLS
jgi:adenosylcobinamide kinase/adenosylcobinamide-phosphate guanylyltransferase